MEGMLHIKQPHLRETDRERLKEVTLKILILNVKHLRILNFFTLF